MERRTLTAITLCFLIFVGWQKFYIEPHQQQMNQAAAQQAATMSSGTATAAGASISTLGNAATTNQPKPSTHPEITVTVAAASGEVTLSDKSRLIKEWTLTGYRKSLEQDSKAVDLNTISNEVGEVEVAFDDPSLSYLNTVQGTIAKTQTGAQWVYEDANVRMVRDVVATPGHHELDVRFNFEFKNGKHPNYAFISTVATRPLGKDAEEQDRQVFYYTKDSIERVRLDKTELVDVKFPVRYIGTANRYFVFATVPAPGSIEPRALVQPFTQPSGATSARISLVYPITTSAISLPVKVYFGPKDLGILRAIDPTLDHVVDLGWFTIFAYPLLKLLKLFYGVAGNYGVAIILLTLLLKIVTYPLTYKSMKNMKEMAKLQPQIQALKERHGDNKEAFNREMLTLMKSNGANPMAGCLPMLVQMPVFFALYRVLYSSIELYQAPFMGWIHDLSAHDPFYVTPVLLTGVMFLQQRITPNTSTDPMQAKMMQWMPVMFGAFMLALPSGLTLYMLVNALAGIGQQFILNKKFDTGHVAAVPARAR